MRTCCRCGRATVLEPSASQFRQFSANAGRVNALFVRCECPMTGAVSATTRTSSAKQPFSGPESKAFTPQVQVLVG